MKQERQVISLIFLAAGLFLVSLSFSEAAEEASNLPVKAVTQVVAANGPAHVDIVPVSPDYFIPNRFKGKTILITGGARGMGRATAIRAAREGANVVVCDWLAKEGAETVEMIKEEGSKAIFVHMDVRKTADCDRMVWEAVKKFGALDLALNAAGVIDGLNSGDKLDYPKQKALLANPIHEASDEYWNQVMNINVTGMFKSMRAELRQMLLQGRGGSIVNIGSVAGVTGLVGNPAYVASKHAVTGLTRSAAIGYATYGIRVNSVNMSATATPMIERFNDLIKAKIDAGERIYVGGFLKTQSLLTAVDSKHRISSVWEQVSMILFLLSDEASNLTGGIYMTDGGYTAY